MLPEWYNDYKSLIEKSIDNYLNNYFSEQKNSGLNIIKESTIYSVKGGKRIRSILALEFFLIFSGIKFEDLKEDSSIIKFCIGLELLHAYSLVHDDLPAMDNDILRRGEPTVWKKYGETNAILVGDLLNSLAFEVISETWEPVLIKYFGDAVGINGMLGGQVLDIYYENNPEKLNLENLIETHNKKTGELITVSVFGGIILAEKDIGFVKDDKSNDVSRFLDFGKKIGLAFQVKDDLLDVEGTIEETGKSVGDGEEKGFVYFLGLNETHKYLDDLLINCREIITELKSERLNFIVDYIGNRKK